MKINVKKFQQGGVAAPVSETEPTPAVQTAEQAQAENPLIQIAQAAMQALQSQDCQLAMQVCQTFIQLIQQSSAGNEAQAPEQGEPVYKKGGVLLRRVKQ